MGYRSEVKIWMNKSTYEHVKSLFKENKIDIEKAFDVQRNGDGDAFIHEEDVKWYTSFPEVDLMDRITREIAREDEGKYQVAFIRAGEDESDIESYNTDGAPYTFSHVEISIEGEEEFE